MKSQSCPISSEKDLISSSNVGDRCNFSTNPDWYLQSEYDAVKKTIRNLCPLNDSCERALGLATRLNTKLTRKEDGFEELIQVVEAHCKQFSVKSMKDLESFY